jgi:hypothetical protein|tara:strand:+ start:602 stop:844 length:243 start_codon:yes stop_codon:yes gene_type:complete
MYELFVLACLMANPNQCITLVDLYSPHETHDKCLARAYVIAQEMPEYVPHYFPKSYKCIDMKKEGEKLTTKWQGQEKEVD